MSFFGILSFYLPCTEDKGINMAAVIEGGVSGRGWEGGEHHTKRTGMLVVPFGGIQPQNIHGAQKPLAVPTMVLSRKQYNRRYLTTNFYEKTEFEATVHIVIKTYESFSEFVVLELANLRGQKISSYAYNSNTVLVPLRRGNFSKFPPALPSFLCENSGILAF